MVGAIVQFIGVITLSNYLANKYGKKSTFIVCLTLTAVFTAIVLYPWRGGHQNHVRTMCFLKSLAYAPTVPLLWAMIGDVADHVEYVNHRRATGFCFSGVVFALKAGLGVGGAFAGLILSGFGYFSGGLSFQSESAVHGIRSGGEYHTRNPLRFWRRCTFLLSYH
jgi:GPH family glycoside/pentoside/hexuronide:cation symporter